MKKAVKWILIAVAGLGVILFGLYKYNLSQTKKHSPEDTVEYVDGDLEITVFYNRPYKKGREIFGGLVPWGDVWRTGANEATTFETNKDLKMGEENILPAGKYTLWTRPAPITWQIIFNDKMYGWGVGFDGEASREPEHDALRTGAEVEKLDDVVEQFTISIVDEGGLKLVFEWDQTRAVTRMEVVE